MKTNNDRTAARAEALAGFNSDRGQVQTPSTPVASGAQAVSSASKTPARGTDLLGDCARLWRSGSAAMVLVALLGAGWQLTSRAVRDLQVICLAVHKDASAPRSHVQLDPTQNWRHSDSQSPA